jgi:hypothetical protein
LFLSEVFFCVAYCANSLISFIIVMGFILFVLLVLSTTCYISMVRTPKGRKSLEIIVTSAHFKLNEWWTNMGN